MDNLTSKVGGGEMEEDKVTYRVETELEQEEDNLEPPFVIAVQGSVESGKTTLIKSLVYHFTRQRVTSVKGTITLRTNRNQRITFLECPTNMQAMVDVAKIADLALLLIDASIGFEMETFEFLCLLHNHGMPNVMGILTHLDYFKVNKYLRRTKKRMKKRFWKEVYDGAKLFYFSGLQADGSYPKTEVNNLSRFITVQKIKLLQWRTQHSYLVADRFDVVETMESQVTNTVSFYGYVRGTYLDKNQRIHINGLGDFEINSLQKIDDPCPIELKRTVKEKQQNHTLSKLTGATKKLRTLKDKEKVLYAPFSNIGALNFEKSTGYITIPDNQVVYTRTDGENTEIDQSKANEGQKMVWKMQDIDMRLEQEIEAPQLLSGIEITEKRATRRLFRAEAADDQDRQDLFKVNEKLNEQSLFREREVDNLHNIIYNNQTAPENDENTKDCNRYDVNPAKLRMFANVNLKKALKAKFVTGQSQDQIVKNLLNMSDSDNEETEKIDKEQLRKLEANDIKVDKKAKRKKRLENMGVKVVDSGSEAESSSSENQNGSDSGEDGEKKKKSKKEEVVAEHAPLKKTDLQIKKSQFLGEKFGHFKIGSYLRIEVQIDKEISRKLEPEYPVVLCSLKHQESSLAFLRVKIKKHRWYPHVLKNKDPLTFSIGWRKFQSIPVFTMEDETGNSEVNMRMIKYTPKFGFCYGVFYSPMYAVGTTFLSISTVADQSHFRICATGVIVEVNSQFKVMKKLKLIGEPFKIHKNTAFVKGMFNSNLEAAKFTGAQLRTVSGIRGTVKRAIKEGVQPGSFRATFEDKILMSDLVFCRTWYQVDVPKLFNPVVAYGNVRMIKTHAQLRKERDLPIPQKKDSEYVHHDEKVDREREERVFAGLQVPKKIEENLPFKQKQRVSVLNDPSDLDKRRQQNLLQALQLPTKRPFKQQFMNEQERKIHSMVQRLAMLDKDYTKDKQEKRDHVKEVWKKRDAKIQEKRDARKKEEKKKEYKKKQYESSKPGKYD